MPTGAGTRMKLTRISACTSPAFIPWIVLAQACSMVAACKEDSFQSAAPQPQAAGRTAAPASGTSLGKDRTPPSNATVVRAEEIRSRIDRFKEWSAAHSPLPRRAINMNTLVNVRKEVTVADVAALLLLLQDEGYDIRIMAAKLLGCVDPNATEDVERQLKLETEVTRRNRLMEAQIEIRGLRQASNGICP